MKLVYLLKNCRFNHIGVIGFSIFTVLGILYGGEGLRFLFENPFYVIINAFFIYIAAASIFGINNVFDVENDKNSEKDGGFFDDTRKLNFIAQGKITKKEGYIFSMFLGITSLTFFFFSNLISFMIAVAIFIFGYIYSAPPLRLKSRPFIDLLYHGSFGGFILFLFGHSLVKIIDTNSLLFSIPLFFICMMIQLENHLQDYKDDKRAGTKTTVVFLGFEKSIMLYTIFSLLTFITIIISQFSGGISFYLGLILLLVTNFNVLFLKKKLTHT